MSKMFYGAIKPVFERAEVLRKNPTHFENILWHHIKANQLGVRFKRQHPIWMYIADFYCHELKLVIEIDGSIHNLSEIMEYDTLREEYIKSFGIKVIRFTNSEIKYNISGVLERIDNVIKEIRTNESKQN